MTNVNVNNLTSLSGEYYLYIIKQIKTNNMKRENKYNDEPVMYGCGTVLVGALLALIFFGLVALAVTGW